MKIFFCMWSMKKSQRAVVITHRRMRTLCVCSVGCLISSKILFFATSRRTLWHWPFPPPFEWNLWLHFPFFLQLFIFILRKLSVSHNRFFYFPLLPAALYNPTHSCPSSSWRQKGQWCLWTREERWSTLIDKFALGGGHRPYFFFCWIHLWSHQMLQIWRRRPAGNLMSLWNNTHQVSHQVFFFLLIVVGFSKYIKKKNGFVLDDLMHIYGYGLTMELH